MAGVAPTSATALRILLSTTMDASTFAALALACAPLVDPSTAHAVVAVESGFNPHAIGVVGGTLVRQPRNRAEALATARALQAQSWDFSVGLAQINLHSLQRLGMSLETAFDPCLNLAGMQAVLGECFERTDPYQGDRQRSLRQALSCYYSGDFFTGFKHGYVRRIVDAVQAPAGRPASPPSIATQELP
jgi:type IV secretion system protein VirB1